MQFHCTTKSNLFVSFAGLLLPAPPVAEVRRFQLPVRAPVRHEAQPALLQRGGIPESEVRRRRRRRGRRRRRWRRWRRRRT